MKTKMSLAEAGKLSRDLITKLSPYCLRIEEAGSLRRKVSVVGDIELIAEPFPTYDLFGEPTYQPHALDELDWTPYGQLIKGGSKYKQILLFEKITLDLFIVTPPAQWGVIFMLRTGSENFSRMMVTAKNNKYPGWMPSCYRVEGGAIWSRNHMIETPEEKDVFDLFGMKYIEPEARSI